MAIHRTLTVHWVDLVQHDDSPLWFGRTMVQDAFAVYRWLYASNDLAVQSRLAMPGWWAGNGVTIPAISQPHSDRRFNRHSWPLDLRRRFASLLLNPYLESDSPMAAWMDMNNVGVGKVSKLPILNDGKENPHYAERAIEAFYGLAGRRYKVSPNSVHPDAINVVYGAIVPIAPRYGDPNIHWEAQLAYGFDGSIWYDYKVCRPRELLIPFLRRSVKEWEAGMEPK